MDSKKLENGCLAKKAKSFLTICEVQIFCTPDSRAQLESGQSPAITHDDVHNDL